MKNQLAMRLSHHTMARCNQPRRKTRTTCPKTLDQIYTVIFSNHFTIEALNASTHKYQQNKGNRQVKQLVKANKLLSKRTSNNGNNNNNNTSRRTKLSLSPTSQNLGSTLLSQPTLSQHQVTIRPTLIKKPDQVNKGITLCIFRNLWFIPLLTLPPK